MKTKRVETWRMKLPEAKGKGIDPFALKVGDKFTHLGDRQQVVFVVVERITEDDVWCRSYIDRKEVSVSSFEKDGEPFFWATCRMEPRQ